jgi:GNAT superfamily N-acetyltransferase
MAGQIGHFNVFASEKVPYAIERYRSETARLYDVLDRRLAETMTDAETNIALVSSFRDDLQLAALYAAAQLGDRPSSAIVEAFRNSRYRIFALYHDRLVGAGRAFGDEVDCAVICDMAVHPEFQGNGLGGRILEALKQGVRHHKRIILYARHGKEEFYLKRGFNRMRSAMLCSFVVPAERNRENGVIE